MGRVIIRAYLNAQRYAHARLGGRDYAAAYEYSYWNAMMARINEEQVIGMLFDPDFDCGGESDIDEDLAFPLPHPEEEDHSPSPEPLESEWRDGSSELEEEWEDEENTIVQERRRRGGRSRGRGRRGRGRGRSRGRGRGGREIGSGRNMAISRDRSPPAPGKIEKNASNKTNKSLASL